VFRLDAERALVQTLDFFPPIVDDPRWFGRIAASNSLSDVYAMGGVPLTAMNIVGWPMALDIEVLGEILAGGLEKVKEAGAVLCGGHSVMDSEVKFGLSVTGLVHPERFWPNCGARQGDVLLLTKALGMGPVSTAIKFEEASAAMQTEAMTQMAALNKAAADAVRDLDVHAATDVTGFGFAGHAFEMAEGAHLALEVQATALPVFDGALDLVKEGTVSGGCTRGRQHYGARMTIAESVDPTLADMIFDAETAGGLLIALPEAQVDEAVRRIAEAGAPCHAVVGRFVAGTADGPVVTIA